MCRRSFRAGSRERLREWRKRKENQWQVKNMRMEKYLLLRDEINADIDRLIDLKTEICKAIDSLPEEKHRNVLERFYLQGMTNREIADELGYNERTVYKLKLQAEKNLENLKLGRK